MTTKKSALICLALIAVTALFGMYAYPRLPAEVVSHWNTLGEPDAYMPRIFGAYLAPLVSFVAFLIIFLAPRFDPLKANIEHFRKYYDGLAIILIIFFLHLQIITLLFNLGYRFNIVQLLAPVIGGLFFYIGILIQHTRRNWIAGIRTPWTLSSDEVWEKTHERSGTLFQGAGVIALLGSVRPEFAFFLIIVPIICVTVYGVVYSYTLYRKVSAAVKK